MHVFLRIVSNIRIGLEGAEFYLYPWSFRPCNKSEKAAIVGKLFVVTMIPCRIRKVGLMYDGLFRFIRAFAIFRRREGA